MKQIDISTPKHPNTFTMVDDEDFDWLNRWKWYAHADRNTMYVHRQSRVLGGKRRTVLMHREILCAGKGKLVDHKNGNGLDNQRSNIRLCTYLQNSQNRNPEADTASGFKGVAWNRCRWQVQIKVNGNPKHIGMFFCLIKAAKAYDKAAIKYHGEFANLNFPRETT